LEQEQDIRWQQRLDHYLKALSQLKKAVELSQQRSLTELEQQGLIQAFEFTHELAWNVIKDYFEYQGNVSITGSRDASREAFQKGLVLDGAGWMEMIKSRNKTSHTYNQSVANDIVEKVLKLYWPLFVDFAAKMEGLKNDVN
jgi:nucleotidyltransferase substrate binding protein (TIGR01987 family)